MSRGINECKDDKPNKKSFERQRSYDFYVTNMEKSDDQRNKEAKKRFKSPAYNLGK